MEQLKNLAFCALLSMVPVVELRGALPVGMAMELPPVLLYIVCVVCNCIPVPVIMLCLRRVLGWMSRRSARLARLSDRIVQRGLKKLNLYYKYELLGLFLLVAIPLPGTGAWTGALVATLLDIRLKNAFPIILAGVATAGIIMLVLSYGVAAIF